MRAELLLFGAAAMVLAPGAASAQTAPGNGQFNGKNYWHMNSGNAFGQPGADCEDLVADHEGATPGHSANSAGGGRLSPARTAPVGRITRARSRRTPAIPRACPSTTSPVRTSSRSNPITDKGTDPLRIGGSLPASARPCPVADVTRRSSALLAGSSKGTAGTRES